MSPQCIVLVLSLCGNLYQGFLLLNWKARRDAGGTPIDCASLCPRSSERRDALPSQELMPRMAFSLDESAWRALSSENDCSQSTENVRSHQSGSSTSTDSSSRQRSSHDQCEDSGHHSHQHDALFFLFNILVLGTALLHISSLYPNLQFTVMLFMLGMVVSFILEGADLKCDTGIVGQSYMMWMDIDPHLVMFTMLPCLLAGDAMTIDTSIAKRVGLQCLYLAGPGLLIQAFSVAAFLKFYLDWSFLLSLVTASILCATDPVAVVSMLKELGASPVLTVQIQGESLLNDGTAIVLYSVAYEMLSGEDYDGEKITMFLVKTALLAVAVGAMVGFVFFYWLRLANDRFNHASGVIQILLTFSAAYWSFIMAEGTGAWKMSGVLATVASSLMLAHFMWPHLVSASNLSHFWHCLEDLMNIIIFILAGSLCGAAMVHIDPMDYLHLLVIYLILAAVRAILIFGSRPLLQCLSMDNMPVSSSDAAVMTWGGLRGAVGLTLAIQVRRSQAANSDGVPQIDEGSAERVLFFVSGIAFLTTLVNATTCPILVQALRLTALPHVQEQFLLKFTHKLVDLSVARKHHPEVTEAIARVLNHVDQDIHARAKKKISLIEAPRRLGNEMIMKVRRQTRTTLRTSIAFAEADLCQLHAAVRSVFELIPEHELKMLDHHSWSFDDLKFDSERMLNLVHGGAVDEEMCRVVNKTFLKLVQSNYQKQLHTGELHPGSRESDILFTSIRVALSPVSVDLSDFDFVNQETSDAGYCVEEKDKLSDTYKEHFSMLGRSLTKGKQFQSMELLEEDRPRSHLDRMLNSAPFSIAVACFILLNIIYVVVDEAARDSSNEGSSLWLATEYFFCVLFTAEAALKLANGVRSYFNDLWNKFDFVLVVLGIMGAIVATVEYASQMNSSGLSNVDNRTRIIRVAKIFRSIHNTGRL